MAQTTAPVLVAGGLYAFDKAFVKKQGIPWKGLLATAIAVAMFAGIEKIDTKVAVRLSYLVLVGELVTSDIVSDLAGWVNGGFQVGAGSGAISTPHTTPQTAGATSAAQAGNTNSSGQKTVGGAVAAAGTNGLLGAIGISTK